MAQRVVAVERFALRQFGGSGLGQIAAEPAAFAARVNEAIAAQGGAEAALRPGYADFCKHVFVENFCGAAMLDLPVTDANRPLLRCAYEARRPSELPVLVRYFREQDVAPVPVAKYLDVILYSREQIDKEDAALPEQAAAAGERTPWGIISIKPQNVDHELPMTPATMLRNALGKDQGGSGVPLDRDLYLDSVRYWDANAAIKSEPPAK